MTDRGSGSDEAEFEEYRQALQEELAEWALHHDAVQPGTVADASSFLDWCLMHAPEGPDYLSEADIEEYLLYWCPRTVIAPPQASAGLVEGVSLAISFLASSGDLSGGRHRGTQLTRYAQSLRRACYHAMGDTSRFGVSKAILANAGLDNIPDTEDEYREYLQRVMDEYNALPYEERKAITESAMGGAPPLPPPPVVILTPTEEELELCASKAPFLTKFEAFREYLGPNGKPLTERGYLKLADGRQLNQILETGEPFDTEWAKRTSSYDVPMLALYFDWMLDSGAIRKQHKKLIPTKSWEKQSVTERATRAAHALIHHGVLTHRGPDYWHYWGLSDFLDDGVPHWMAILIWEGGEVAFDQLLESAREALGEWNSPWFDPEETIERAVGRIFDGLELAGILEWDGSETLYSEYTPGHVDYRRGGSIRLTPIGLHIAPDHLLAAGYEVTTVPDLIDMSGSELLNTMYEFDITPEEAFTRWKRDRSEEERVREMAEALRVAASADQRVSAIGLLAMTDPHVATPVLLEMLATPSSTRQHVATVLMMIDPENEETYGPYLGPSPMIDSLATMLDYPDDLCESFVQGDRDMALVVLDSFWRNDTPETAVVLEALGKHLPDRELAKAARRAATKHRSYIASRN